MSSSPELSELYSEGEDGSAADPGLSRQDSAMSQLSDASTFAGFSGDEGFLEDDTVLAEDEGAVGGADSGGEADGGDAYEVLTPSDLLERQIGNIEEVNKVLEIPAGTARILLAHFKWDKDRLMERYYGSDQERLFREAGAIMPPSTCEEGGEGGVNGGSGVGGSSVVSPDQCCEICFTDFPGSEFRKMPCGHAFCSTCWADYLEENIIGQGQAAVCCPAYGCNIFVDEFTVSSLLAKRSEVLHKYYYLAAKDFVMGNKHIRWCPSPGCENAIRSADTSAHPVRCTCGHTFCFKCTEPAHAPIKCAMLKLWLKKCADDSETSNWIAANTKECPKCSATIEKNGGCNHMVCRNTSCKYEFCWVCLGPWAPHGSSWYNCNRFEEKDSKAARTAQDKSRDSLKRYLFYFNRYANHQQSRKLEGKLWSLVQRKQDEMQSASMSWIEVQFLSHAVTTLSQCRTTLMYTYVFAFYLKKNNQCVIFESNQSDLETATERLSHYLEQEAGDAGLVEMRQTVLDLCKYVESRRQKLLDHVLEGTESCLWEYNLETVAAAVADDI
eukprot:UC1_evm4s2143